MMEICDKEIDVPSLHVTVEMRCWVEGGVLR